MKIGQQDRFLVINQTASSLYSLIADGQYLATSLGRDVWKKVVGQQASLQYNCNKEGFNVVCPGGIKTRIGIISDDERSVSCGGCDSAITFGGDIRVCGNRAYYLTDNGGKDIPAMGYILIQ